jgi:uncharacterized protein
MDNRVRRLKAVINRYRSAAVAFSGGADSTLLASVAGEVLGKKVLLISVMSPFFPRSELKEARSLAARLGLPHRVLAFSGSSVAPFSVNTPDRCYRCKRVFFSRIWSMARMMGCETVFDGSNADDRREYRPGMRALAQLGVVSPLREAGITKAVVRRLSARRGLPVAGKPSYPCLASRFPYGEKLTIDKLRRVERAESSLRAFGFGEFRVRSHGDCARVEVGRPELGRAWRERGRISRACRKAGFAFAALDADGFRSGAMDETLGRRGRHHGER